MVYLHGDVYWYRIRLTLPDANGKRKKYDIRRSAHTGHKRQAEDDEQDYERALRKGDVHPWDPWPKAPPSQAPTLRGFAGRFVEYVRSHRKPSTAAFYDACLKRTLRFHPLSEIPMSAVTGELVAKYVGFRQSVPKGNSIATLNAELRTLRRAFRLAEEWGLIPKAPKIHVPDEGKVIRDRVVTFDEERRYLDAASPTLRDLATLATDTALRPNSELFPLLWSNVHLEVSAEAPYGCIHVPGGKTDAARRSVPLTPRGKTVLERRRGARVASWYVFPGEGRSGHIMTAQHAHERTMKRAGIRPFEFYCWRHTCATRWAQAGLDKYTVAKLMGHSSPRVADRYYIHITDEHVGMGFQRFLGYLDRSLTPEQTQPTEANNISPLKEVGTKAGIAIAKSAVSH